jgi:DNA-binding response OmpR family regulator
MRIAIVNDSDALLRTLRVCFEAHGHQTLTVAIWEIRFPHLELPQVVTAFRPDVLVYDIGMPFTSSWDFYCIVREISDLKHIPTVLTTANSAAMHRQLELRIQAYEVTGTPDNLDGLLALVSATAVRESDD